LPLKVILLYIACAFVADSLLIHYYYDQSKISFYIVSLFTVAEYTLFTIYVYSLLKKRILRAILIVCSFLFWVSSIIFFLNSSSSKFDSITASLVSLLILGYSIFYLYEFLTDPELPIIYESPHFWIIIGFMIYCAGSFFLFLNVNFMSQIVIKDAWKINLVCNVLKNIFFTVAFIIPKNTTPTQNHTVRPQLSKKHK
jgi:hypothetical protein